MSLVGAAFLRNKFDAEDVSRRLRGKQTVATPSLKKTISKVGGPVTGRRRKTGALAPRMPVHKQIHRAAFQWIVDAIVHDRGLAKGHKRGLRVFYTRAVLRFTQLGYCFCGDVDREIVVLFLEYLHLERQKFLQPPN